MKSSKNIFTFLVILMLAIPTHVVFAQESRTEIETFQNEESTGSIKEKKDKKKTEKDLIQINNKFFSSIGINFLTVLILIFGIYYPNYKKWDYVFTFVMFNVVIFLLTYVLNEVKISMGAAFGLFAIFSMLRYRTEGISMKDMTYLFVFIAIGLVGAINLEYAELALLNGIIIIVLFIFDNHFLVKHEISKIVKYENIDLIKPESRNELLADLENRTGLKINRFSLGKIDFLKDTAFITIYYQE